ncbi:MAG: ABC transporter substrate-binding protein [Alphaproteobacteria bacterium]|nr:ABC transporter substrate-binding protein [Alphaproteobacteria bacterium]
MVAVALAAFGLGGGTAFAQNEQFIPRLVYRTGPYAPNGIPFADGYADYLDMINARDGGVNGVKITYEECETGYNNDKGVECYERLKGKGPTGASLVDPLSTGITYALIVFFLIVEPNGLARLWAIGKEKLRIWPFPH